MWASIIDKGITILLTGSVLAFIEYLIDRHDGRKDKKEGLSAAIASVKSSIEALKADFDKRFKMAEKDALRTQLLVMISQYPHEKKEILTLGERYFSKPPDGLDGNWYMTDIFQNWLIKEGHSNPEWFKQ